MILWPWQPHAIKQNTKFSDITLPQNDLNRPSLLRYEPYNPYTVRCAYVLGFFNGGAASLLVFASLKSVRAISPRGMADVGSYDVAVGIGTREESSSDCNWEG